MSDMMSARNFNNNSISGCQVEPFRVDKKIFAPIFEPDLHYIEFIFTWHLHIREPVEDVHLITAASTTCTIIVAASDRTILG